MWLIVNPGLSTERVLPLSEGDTTIGRAEENNICVSHISLSRLHARLVRKGDEVELIDETSKNGTFVNEARVTRCELRAGDSFRCGEVSFKLMALREPKPTHVQDPRNRPVNAVLRGLKMDVCCAGGDREPRENTAGLQT